jgi:hypothetical protein
MTGGELFDLFQAGDLEYWLGDLQAAYDTAAAETEQAPILLQVFRSI